MVPEQNVFPVSTLFGSMVGFDALIGVYIHEVSVRPRFCQCVRVIYYNSIIYVVLVVVLNATYMNLSFVCPLILRPSPELSCQYPKNRLKGTGANNQSLHVDLDSNLRWERTNQFQNPFASSEHAQMLNHRQKIKKIKAKLLSFLFYLFSFFLHQQGHRYALSKE